MAIIDGTIRSAIGKVDELFRTLADKGWLFSGNGSMDSLVQGSALFGMAGLVAIAMMFYVRIHKHNKMEGVKIDSLKEGLTFLGRDLWHFALIPGSIALALTAHSLVLTSGFDVYGMTSSSAFAACTVGDKMLDGLVELVSSDSAVENAALAEQTFAGDPKDPKATKTPELIQDAIKLHAEVVTLKADAAKALRAADSETDPKEKANLQSIAKSKVDSYGKGVQAIVASREAVQGEIKKRNDAVNIDLANGVNSADLRADINQSWENGGAPAASSVLEKRLEKPSAGILDAGSMVASFIGNIYYYCSIAPAILGIGAGILSTAKAALGLLQFGAKVSILLNLGYSLAVIFAPLFGFLLLFEKTQSYALTYYRYLFSGVLFVFGVHMVTAILGNGLTPAVQNLAQGLSASIRQGIYAGQDHTGSFELFKTSIGIGLQGFAVGMMVEFLLDIIKAAGKVAQGLLSGNFDLG